MSNINQNSITKMFDAFEKFDDEQKFNAIFILILSIFIFSRIPITINSIVGVIIGIGFIGYYHFNNQEIKENKNLELMSKLQTIEEVVPTEILYKDPDMINLLYKIFYYTQYNKEAYIELVQKVELIIKTVYFYDPTELKPLGQGYQVFQGVPVYENEKDCSQRIKFINVLIDDAKEIFNGFVYSLPGRSNIIKKDFEDARYRFILLLIRHKDVLLEECKLKTLNSIKFNSGEIRGVAP